MNGCYPKVIGEFETVRELLTGKSLARFGDGEFKLIDGKGYFREPGCDQIAAELLATLTTPHPNCLVGIPTMDPGGPKFEGWIRHRKRFARTLGRQQSEPFTVRSNAYCLMPIDYYSAFVTRPDSAPWINTLEYAQLIERLWRAKRTVVLAEPGNSILKVAALSAKKLKHIACPHREAYAQIDQLERLLAHAKPEIALLSCGPTATCLANRLAARDIQAIDIGSAGGFLLRLLNFHLRPAVD